MFHEKIPAPQLSAWLFTATVPVLIQLMGGQSWIWVGIAGVISVILAMLLWRRGWKVPKWQCLILYIYTVLLLSQLLPHAALSWPTGDATVVPLILLALAVWSAQKGTSAAARTGAVLFWVVLILYLAVFGAGVRDVQWKWLRPQWDAPDLLGLAVFLVPMATASMLRSRGKTSPRLVLLPAFVLVSVLITAGVMSPTVANKMPNAFYEMSRSINLLGIAQRFEPLISAAMTVGWFAFFSLLLSLCGKYAQKIFAGKGKAGVWVAAIVAAAVRLCGLHISGLILLVCASVFWVGFPILTQGIEPEKKS